jgi:hypothetical protein
MVMAFLLIMIVDGEMIESNQFVFQSVYRCNQFARALETGETSFRYTFVRSQTKITAYCVPKMVPANTTFRD